MAYNFTPYRPRESNVEPGSLGIKIASLLMQGQNMKQENALRTDAAKQQALDRVVEQQQQQRAMELAQSFPTEAPPPSSYDEAVTGFGKSPSDVYEAQNKWLGQNAGKLAGMGKYGTQIFGQLQQVADNTRMLQLGTEMRTLANKEAMRRIDITRKFGAFTPENEALYNTDQSLEEIQKDFGRDNLVFKEIPPGVINEKGFINRLNLLKWKGTLMEDQASINAVPNTEFERNVQRVRELERTLPMAASQEEDTRIREEIKWRRDRLGRSNAPTAELSPEHRAMWSAERKQILGIGGPDVQSKLAELDARFGLTPEASAPNATVGVPSGPVVQQLLPGSKKPYTIRSVP